MEIIDCLMLFRFQLSYYHIKTKKHTLVKQNLKICLIFALLLSSGGLCVSAQSVAELNKEKYYKLEINQYDYSVLNSYPQAVVNIKNKKNKAAIKLKTHGTVNEYTAGGKLSAPFEKNLVPADLEKYLSSSDLIDYNEENVMDIYHKLNLSSLSEYQCAKTILTFLVSVLKYDNELAVEISSGLSCGKSASWVLENKKGTCGEYSNLFIALMRLKGIPCKFVTGLYCSSGQVAFHAWAEFYDARNGWIAVDPQGGILGVSSNHIKLKEGIDFADADFDMAKCDFKIRCIKK